MKKTESHQPKKEDFTTVRYYFMAFHAEKGFSAETFATFQGFFKKFLAVLSSISEFEKSEFTTRTHNLESEQRKRTKPRPTLPRTQKHQPHDMFFAAHKKRKKIKEKSIQKVGQKIPESVLYYFRA